MQGSAGVLTAATLAAKKAATPKKKSQGRCELVRITNIRYCLVMFVVNTQWSSSTIYPSSVRGMVRYLIYHKPIAVPVCCRGHGRLDHHVQQDACCNFKTRRPSSNHHLVRTCYDPKLEQSYQSLWDEYVIGNQVIENGGLVLDDVALFNHGTHDTVLMLYPERVGNYAFGQKHKYQEAMFNELREEK
ncbi:hypothetical protein BDV12DRAFT_195187 [Aspergillus spectabilis]